MANLLAYCTTEITLALMFFLKYFAYTLPVIIGIVFYFYTDGHLKGHIKNSKYQNVFHILLAILSILVICFGCFYMCKLVDFILETYSWVLWIISMLFLVFIIILGIIVEGEK